MIYATLDLIFIASSFTIVLLTYWLTSSSLTQRDHEIVQTKLGEYANVYAQGGLRALAAAVDAEQRTSRERVFVRVLDGFSDTVLLSNAEGWDAATLDIGAITLLDGTVMQVGKGTEVRADILARFRAALGLEKPALSPKESLQALRVVELLLRVLAAQFQQACGTQEGADVLGAEWRHGRPRGKDQRGWAPGSINWAARCTMRPSAPGD